MSLISHFNVPLTDTTANFVVFSLQAFVLTPICFIAVTWKVRGLNKTIGYLFAALAVFLIACIAIALIASHFSS